MVIDRNLLVQSNVDRGNHRGQDLALEALIQGANSISRSGRTLSVLLPLTLDNRHVFPDTPLRITDCLLALT